MTDQEMDATCTRRRDHRPAVRNGKRHRLLDQDVLAASRGKPDMLEMQLVRRGDVDRLDRVIGAKRLHAIIGPRRQIRRREVPFELPAGLTSRVGRSDEPDQGMMCEGRQHQHEGSAKPDDTQPQGLAHGTLLEVEDKIGRSGPRDADHDVPRALVLGQSEVAMVRFAWRPGGSCRFRMCRSRRSSAGPFPPPAAPRGSSCRPAPRSSRRSPPGVW